MGNAVGTLIGWALFVYLVRAAMPRIRSDLSRLRSWLGMSGRNGSARRRADRAKPGSTAPTDPAPDVSPLAADAEQDDPARSALRRARAVSKHRATAGRVSS